MKKLPLKNSKNWLWVFLVYWLLVYGGFIITRLVLDTQLTPSILTAFAILALISAFIPCLVGFLGGQMFFLVNAFFSGIGIIYMFVVILKNMSPGWEDLTSVLSYIFVSLIGIIIGIIAQIFTLVAKRQTP